jgi:hypothetical protein
MYPCCLLVFACLLANLWAMCYFQMLVARHSLFKFERLIPMQYKGIDTAQLLVNTRQREHWACIAGVRYTNMQQLWSYAVRIVTTSTELSRDGGCAGMGCTGGWERARATSLCPPAAVVGVTRACAP